MPEYTLLCNACAHTFERFSWGELEDKDRVCEDCQSGDVKIQWIIEQPFENLANFGCA